MLVMKKIETGVDKLVKLIEEKKRISVDQAAKILGVSTVLVQEWADFLEEDGLISVDYSLSKVWLSEKKLSQKELERKNKELANHKEAFLRKVETTLKTLEKDTIGFEKMKKEFDDLKRSIGGEIEDVQKELEELEYYDNLKKNIDKDIQKQREEYDKLIKESHLQIKNEERRFQELIARVKFEREKVNRDKKQIASLEEQERLIKSKIDEMNNLLSVIRKKINEEEKRQKVEEESIAKLERMLESIEHRLKEKKHEAIVPLIKMSEEHRNKIINLQSEILKKLEEKKKRLSAYKGQDVKVAKNLKRFFEKKERAEKLLEKINAEKKELEKEYELLMKKAKAFKVKANKPDLADNLLALEKRYQEMEKKRNKLLEEIKKLSSIIKG